MIYCFLGLLWLGVAGMVGYCLYDCWDIIGMLILVIICSLVECILLVGIGVAKIAGWH